MGLYLRKYWVLLSLEIFCCDMLDCSSGGPLLLMELAFLLRGVGVEVCWMTIQKPLYLVRVVYSLEHKMLNKGVQVREIRYLIGLFVSCKCSQSCIQLHSTCLCLFVSLFTYRSYLALNFVFVRICYTMRDLFQYFFLLLQLSLKFYGLSIELLYVIIATKEKKKLYGYMLLIEPLLQEKWVFAAIEGSHGGLQDLLAS